MRPGVLALGSSTCAYDDDDGKKQHDFHGEKLHQVVVGAMDRADRVIAVDWSVNRNLGPHVRALAGSTPTLSQNVQMRSSYPVLIQFEPKP